MNKKKIVKIISFVVFMIVVFSYGFSLGNIRLEKMAKNKYLEGTKEYLVIQGEKPEAIAAELKMIMADRASQEARARREIFGIFIPSILVVINIYLTLKYRKVE